MVKHSRSKKKEFQKNENQRDKIDDESRHTSEENERKEDLKKKTPVEFKGNFFWLTCASQWNECTNYTATPRTVHIIIPARGLVEWVKERKKCRQHNERFTRKYLFNTAVADAHSTNTTTTKANKRTIQIHRIPCGVRFNIIIRPFRPNIDSAFIVVLFIIISMRPDTCIHVDARAADIQRTKWNEKNMKLSTKHTPKQRDGDFERCVERLLPSDSVEP